MTAIPLDIKWDLSNLFTFYISRRNWWFFLWLYLFPSLHFGVFSPLCSCRLLLHPLFFLYFCSVVLCHGVLKHNTFFSIPTTSTQYFPPPHVSLQAKCRWYFSVWVDLFLVSLCHLPFDLAFFSSALFLIPGGISRPTNNDFFPAGAQHREEYFAQMDVMVLYELNKVLLFYM